MFALLSRRLRRWLILTVVVPIVGAFARHLADRIEQRQGKPTTVSKGMRQVGKLGSRTKVGQAINPPKQPPGQQPPAKRTY